MKRHELQNAAEKIHGYYLPPDVYGISLEDEFDKAKEQCIAHLKRQLAHVESLAWDQFKSLYV